MKQIDIIRTYAQKQCLVVDDSVESRANVKRILVDFGAEQINTAGNAEEAIELCQRKEYDLVISEYNLGNGKSGQQLLEELRFNGWLSQSALFIIIATDNSVHDVLHAIENQPDDFISKPITKSSLRPRLDQALLKAESLIPIKHSLGEGKILKAIDLCQKHIQNSEKHLSDVQKILGDLYIRTKNWERAEETFEHANVPRRLIWAEIGIAYVAIETDRIEEAEKRLCDIIELQPYCVEAMDLLAKVYLIQEQPQLAQNILEKAISTSPKAPARHREIAHVSQTIGDEIRAIHAYRSAIKLSRNSCHESPEDNLSLAQNLKELAKKADEAEQKSYLKEADNVLQSIGKKYEKHPIIKLKKQLLNADLSHTEERFNDEKAALSQAALIVSDLDERIVSNCSFSLCIDCAEMLIILGDYGSGEKLLDLIDDENLSQHQRTKVDALLKEPRSKEGLALAKEMNKKGIDLYQDNQFDAAIATFCELLEKLPNHVGVNLNLAQTLIGKYKDAGLNEKEIKQLKISFTRAKQIGNASDNAKRYAYLEKYFDLIVQSPDAIMADSVRQ